MASKTKGRVKVPRRPADLLELAGKIYAKYTADGDASPLNNLEDNDWAVTGPKVASTLALHNEAERYKGLMEKAYAERDKHLPEIEDTVRNSAGLLKSINIKNPKRLTDYGFNVDDTPPAPKANNGTNQS